MSENDKPKNLTDALNRIPAKMFWIALVVIFLSFAAISFANTPDKSDASRAKAVSQQLRCLECEGLSVYESETQTSKSIVKDVQRRVKDGQSNEQILSYYEGIYGEYIRLSPSTDNGNWLIYLLPLFGGVVLIAAIFISIKSSSTKLKIGFWCATALVAVVVIGIYASDVNNSDQKSSVTETTQNVNSLENLQKAADLDPSNKNLRNLAIVQFAQEKYVDALKNFDAAAKLDPKDSISRGYGSYIVMLSGEYGLALQRANDAVVANPQEPTGLFFRGLIYYSIPTTNKAYVTNAKELANADFDKVQELAPSSEFAAQINEIRNIE